MTKRYGVLFTVRAESLDEALRQSEALLNGDARVVDHDVFLIHGPQTVGAHGWPAPADDPEPWRAP